MEAIFVKSRLYCTYSSVIWTGTTISCLLQLQLKEDDLVCSPRRTFQCDTLKLWHKFEPQEDPSEKKVGVSRFEVVVGVLRIETLFCESVRISHRVIHPFLSCFTHLKV